MSDKYCIDIDGNKVFEGDLVEVYHLVGCKDYIGIRSVWRIGDMNENQKDMPYILSKGAWHPKAIRKYMSKDSDE